MNLFKKATATLALVTLVSGIFSAGVSADSSTEIEAANGLAAEGYIVDHSDDTTAYNLNQNVLRQEIAAVARGIAGLEKKTTCDASFTDVTATTPNTWACYSVEALLDADLIAANTMFKPETNISKAEAIGMMVKAAYGDDYAYDAAKAASWQEQVVEFAVSEGIVANFTNYDTPATRGFVFEAGYNAMMAEEVVEACDEVSQLLGLCDEEDNTDDEDDTDTPVIVDGDNVLMAELSAETPEGMDITKDAKGVKVLSFDVTAGSEDVSITAMQLERAGFGSTAADEVAIFSEEGRVSKNKSFNSDDEANVTFSPAVVVKAGETRTLTARVNVDGTGEFSIKVIDITASSTVDAATIVSNLFDAKDTAAAILTVKDEGVSTSINAGEEQADLAEFNLKNEGSTATSADVDITVSSVTLKEVGSVDQEESLENLSLYLDGEIISTVSMMTGKYVTFEFDGVVIEDGKNESFTVKADIMGGAGDTVQFELDSLVDIEAKASRYNSVNVAMDTALTTAGGLFDEISIDAGELTIYSIDAEVDEIRGDKDDVVLGQLKIVNVAGKNLELDNLKFNLDLAGATTTTVDELEEVLENVEVEINGTSYDLNVSGDFGVINGDADYSETDMDIVLPQGTTILTIRADTQKDLDDDTTITMTLTGAGTTGLKVVETEDDETVDDVSPSSLSWDAVTVKNASVTVSNVPLADVKVVKGATDIVALQFDVEAGKASSVYLDEVKVNVFTSTGVALDNDYISEVALYKGSVSDSNILDRVSGSKLASGVATFDGFEVEIAADATQTFLVTINTVDTTTVIGTVIQVELDQANLSLEDDENDTITLSSSTLEDKIITIQDSGILTLTADANNDDNDDVKTILAGEEEIVYSADVLATNEDINVDTVRFTLDEELKNVILGAKLYLDDNIVATANNSDVVDGTGDSTITFDNADFDIDTDGTQELRLAIDTQNIGYEKVGETVTDVLVTLVEIEDAEGTDSGEDVTVTDLSTTKAVEFNVVPVVITASVDSKLSTGSAEIKFTANAGNNTQSGSSAAPVVTIDSLVFSELGNDDSYTIYEEGNSGSGTTGAINTIAAAAPISGLEFTDSVSIVVLPTGTADSTYTLKLTKTGFAYTVDGGSTLNINSTSELDLGSKTY